MDCENVLFGRAGENQLDKAGMIHKADFVALLAAPLKMERLTKHLIVISGVQGQMSVMIF